MGQIWHAQEPRGARVVHVRSGEGGLPPLEAFRRAIDDDTLLVSLTHVSYRTGALLDVAPIVRARARARRARPARRLPVGRLAAARRALARRRFPRRRHGEVPAGLGGARASSTRDARRSARSGRPRPAGSPTATSSRWTSGTTRPTRPRAASSTARRPSRPSTPASPGSSCCSAIGVAETRAHVNELNHRLLEGLDELRATVVDAAQARPARRARLRPLERRAGPRRGAAPRGHRHLRARRQPADLRARLQRRGGRRRRPRGARAEAPPARLSERCAV